jgi:hypothetical protein
VKEDKGGPTRDPPKKSEQAEAEPASGEVRDVARGGGRERSETDRANNVPEHVGGGLR